MRKIYLLFFSIFISLITYSQEFRLGVESGFTKSVYSISNDGMFLKSSLFELPENVNVKFSYSKNNIFINSGIGFFVYNESIPYETGSSVFKHIARVKKIYKTISIPVQLGYRFELFSNFFVKYASGFDFDFLFDKHYMPFESLNTGQLIENEEGRGRIEFTSFYWEGAYKRSFNVLLSQSLSLSYEIKKKVYVDLFCEYHAGLLKVIDTNGIIIDSSDSRLLDNVDIYRPTIISNGSYWRIGLGLGYIF